MPKHVFETKKCCVVLQNINLSLILLGLMRLHILISFHVTKATRSTQTRDFFLGKMCLDRSKNHLWTEKPEGTSFAMFNFGSATKCCEFKQYVLRLDSMLRELSE